MAIKAHARMTMPYSLPRSVSADPRDGDRWRS
jgi:hypothetical protein